MQRSSLLAWAVLAIFHSAGAAAGSFEEYKPQFPDHLVPVPPHLPELHFKYIRSCYNFLRIPESEGLDPFMTFPPRTVAMVRMPPFDPESCIVLREQGKRDHPEFVLIHNRTSRNVYFSMPENASIDEDENKGEPRKRARARPREEVIKSVKTTKSLDPNRAARVVGLWERMLQGVRYPIDVSASIEDADIYEFRYRWKGMYGEAKDPLKGPVRRLVNLGDAMIAVCDSADADLEKNLARLDAACEALEKQLAAQEEAAKKGNAKAAR